jgi:hypothetical protein
MKQFVAEHGAAIRHAVSRRLLYRVAVYESSAAQPRYRDEREAGATLGIQRRIHREYQSKRTPKGKISRVVQAVRKNRNNKEMGILVFRAI